MNTYIFKLRKGNLTQEKIVREESVEGARRQMDPELDEGWEIVDTSENGLSLPS